MPTSEYWRNYRREYRRKQYLQRQQLEGKDAQYLADFGALQRDINSFREKYNTKVRSDLSMADILQLGGSETVGENTPLIIDHDRKIHKLIDRQNEHEISGGHISAEEKAELNLRLDKLEASFAELLGKIYKEFFGEEETGGA